MGAQIEIYTPGFIDIRVTQDKVQIEIVSPDPHSTFDATTLSTSQLASSLILPIITLGSSIPYPTIDGYVVSYMTLKLLTMVKKRIDIIKKVPNLW